MAIKHVAILLSLAVLIVIGVQCIRGEYLKAGALLLVSIICIGGGLSAQTPSGRTKSTSA